MQLPERIAEFIAHPFPLWEDGLTEVLISQKMASLINAGAVESEKDYSTPAAFFKRPYDAKSLPLSVDRTYMEYPSFDALGAFYDEHGLVPVQESDLLHSGAALKLTTAFDALRHVPGCQRCVTMLAKRIQVLRQEHRHYDTSYSHPDIPFSIFVSVCEDSSLLSSLRVAENILHEAMHLKLTLIEEITPLIEAGTRATYYSPWRDEQRPLRGVFHGLFVFTAIRDYYSLLKGSLPSEDTAEYLSYRIETIDDELSSLSKFAKCDGLTTSGRKLITSLSQHPPR